MAAALTVALAFQMSLDQKSPCLRVKKAKEGSKRGVEIQKGVFPRWLRGEDAQRKDHAPGVSKLNGI
jgi:hypothetical protein